MSRPTSKFEILRRRPVLNASGVYASETLATASDGAETAARGLALGAHPTSKEAFDEANGKSFIGHLTRRVVKGGLTLTDRVFGVTSAVPVGLESPFKDGEEVSVERAEEIEVEGPAYIMTSGTGAIDTNTAVPSSLSFIAGRLRVAQTGDVVFYTLTANNLTPTDDGNSELRIRAQAV
jgi:hypothetical protein